MEYKAKEVGFPTISIDSEGMGTAVRAAIRVDLFYYTESTNGQRSARPTTLSSSTNIDKRQAGPNMSRVTQWLSYSIYDKGVNGSSATGKHAKSKAAAPCGSQLPDTDPKETLLVVGPTPK